MAKEELKDLLQLYLSGSSTLEDQIRLAHIINRLDDNDLEPEVEAIWNKKEITHKLSEDKAAQILSQILNEDRSSLVNKSFVKKRRLNRLAISIAASVLIVLGSIGFWKMNTPNDAIIIKKEVIATTMPTSYSRYIILPDSSLVLLKAKSSLAISESFNRESRTVELKGEAYFDIKHNPNKPFIINSGEIKTTVLGTAFNIKAWDEEKKISIVVTRGKVMVQSHRKVLALLTKNQRIVYNTEEKVANKENRIDAQKTVVDWTKKEMTFDGIDFEDIVKILGRRYEKTIIVQNPVLLHHKLVASFNGTETLDNVLSTLCQIMDNVRYRIENDDVVIY